MIIRVIDTAKALSAAHRLFERGHKLKQKNPEEAERICDIANSGFSATIPYLRNSRAPVLPAHYESIEKMLALSEERT